MKTETGNFVIQQQVTASSRGEPAETLWRDLDIKITGPFSLAAARLLLEVNGEPGAFRVAKVIGNLTAWRKKSPVSVSCEAAAKETP